MRFSAKRSGQNRSNEFNSIRKILFTIVLGALPLLCLGQSDLESRIAEAKEAMDLRNMYHTIRWNMSPLNEYFFDQEKGEVTYYVDDKGYEVIAKTKILGTWNLDDNTFLWADKNSSIFENQSDQVDAFRKTLPAQYQKDKFEPSDGILEDLLALFSYDLQANGYERKRQENVIVFYALLNIKIVKEGGEMEMIEPNSYHILLKKPQYIDLLKAFHKEKMEVNRQYKDKEISDTKAFRKIKKVHLKYWRNEDEYYFPTLCWPCHISAASVTDWKEFSIDDRHFVMYTADVAGMSLTYAYEIDVKAKGTKVIIDEFW